MLPLKSWWPTTPPLMIRPELLMKWQAPVAVRQVALDSRQGPARARNAALDEASGQLVVFVDSDVIVSPRFFEVHLATYRQVGRQAYVVGTLVSVPSLEGALKHPAPTAWDYSGATLDTANASVPWESLEAVGFFDSGFEGMGWQDLDLGRRLKKHGLARVHAREARLSHSAAHPHQGPAAGTTAKRKGARHVGRAVHAETPRFVGSHGGSGRD